MIIEPVDSLNDLFLVIDPISNELMAKLSKEDFWQYSWERQDMQQNWNRRKLIPNALLQQIDEEYLDLLDQIELAVNIKFTHKHCYSSFWLDYENFTCGIHEDGAERNYTPLMAMQIYLTEANHDLGTVWYNDAEGKSIRYQFPYKKNTGYLMLNRPGQYHGMTNSVPAGHLRLSSYTYFGNFDHK